MRIVMFYHSLVSDWNHGNAHFLRGIVWELVNRGHDVHVLEPRNAWSRQNLQSQHGTEPFREFRRRYPGLKSTQYNPATINLEAVLESADLVLVHEWSDHDLVRRIGVCRHAMNSFLLLFHDTHHRAVTDTPAMAAYDLSAYDGVLAFGNVLRDMYLQRRWTRRAFTWHEAADTRVFRPIADQPNEGDLVWVGNWGDDERTAELHEFLLEPVRSLRLRAKVYGVRYPATAIKALKAAGIAYGGWLSNYRAPEEFARYRVTVHVPRRPYVEALPGIPTIRVFEALACGIPLVCSPWNDSEHLFEPGRDYLVARDGAAMAGHLRTLTNDHAFARHLADRGHRTILSRHTCAHRVDELLSIVAEMQAERAAPVAAPRVRRSKPRRAALV